MGSVKTPRFSNLRSPHSKARLAASLAVLISIPIQSSTADLIAEWTFETSTPASLSNSTTYTGINANSGAGILSGMHADSRTDWSTPSGNGSSESFSSNGWGIGDYYQFEVSTIDFSDITLSWDQLSSTTGPGTFDLVYSIDGISFATALDDYSVKQQSSAWTSSTPISDSSHSFDFSTIEAVEGVETLTVRLVSQELPSFSGTNRIDNIVFSGIAAVPEPTAFLFGSLVAGSVGMVVARRRPARKPLTDAA